MIVDSSALLAVLFDEPDSQKYNTLIVKSPCLLSVVNALESAIVVESLGGRDGGDALDEYLVASGISVVPVTEEQFSAARTAWRRFGKGHHQAALNLDDCFSYSLARTSGEPLLFKGLDFGRQTSCPHYSHLSDSNLFVKDPLSRV